MKKKIMEDRKKFSIDLIFSLLMLFPLIVFLIFCLYRIFFEQTPITDVAIVLDDDFYFEYVEAKVADSFKKICLRVNHFGNFVSWFDKFYSLFAEKKFRTAYFFDGPKIAFREENTKLLKIIPEKLNSKDIKKYLTYLYYKGDESLLPEEDTFLKLPNRRVSLTLKSVDAICTLEIPELGISEKVEPGELKKIIIKPKEIGLFQGVYSLNGENKNIYVRVVSVEEFYLYLYQLELNIGTYFFKDYIELRKKFVDEVVEIIMTKNHLLYRVDAEVWTELLNIIKGMVNKEGDDG